MTIEEARAQLADMVDADATPALTEADLNTALAMSRIADPDGRPPADPDWVPTWDLYWAAAETAIIRARKQNRNPGVRKFTSEGATFEKDRTDWLAEADLWRRQSPLFDPSRLGRIVIDHEQVYKPRSDEFPWSTRAVGE